MQLDEGTFPEQWRLYCLFCNNPEPYLEPYEHGYQYDHYWTCPKCHVSYRFGRAMYGSISGPFINIKMPEKEELSKPYQDYNPQTGFVEPKRKRKQ